MTNDFDYKRLVESQNLKNISQGLFLDLERRENLNYKNFSNEAVNMSNYDLFD